MRYLFIAVLAVLLGRVATAEPVVLEIEHAPGEMVFWLESSLSRVYPAMECGRGDIEVLAPRNGRIAFQACVRNKSSVPRKVSCKIVGLDGIAVRVRLVGLVPMPHFTGHTDLAELDGVGYLPGLAPDPLLPQSEVMVGSYESRSFWVTLDVPAGIAPGVRDFEVRLLPENEKVVVLRSSLEVSEFVVAPRRDFHVIHWWRGEATWDWYKTGMFEDPRWWELTRDQLENMLSHGSDVVYVPMFFDRREIFKRPCQLLIVDEPQPGEYTFDWSEVKRFVDMCKEIGFEHFEWSHLWIYWGVENPIRVYRKMDGEYVTLWDPDISGFSDTFVNFLKQFLPSFHEFLSQEGLLERSYFHLSDEPGAGQHIANYRRAREILCELAPWMKVMDALSNIEYGRQKLTDIPVPLVDSAAAYVKEGIPHWVYYCCVPRGPWLNRFIDTPLPKIRMAGWLFYRFGAEGFLHWGFNYWHKMESEVMGDPFQDGSNGAWLGIPYGDPFVVYPGPEECLDSIRWEVFAESLQDYAILQTAGVDPDGAMLTELKSYAEFPKSRQWIEQALRKILKPE